MLAKKIRTGQEIKTLLYFTHLSFTSPPASDSICMTDLPYKGRHMQTCSFRMKRGIMDVLLKERSITEFFKYCIFKIT